MSKRLIVVVPGIGQTTRKWEPLIAKLSTEEELKEADWMRHDHNAKWWSWRTIPAVARNLAADIGEQADGTDHITLIGHSLGGILIRAAYLQGSREKRDWAGKVDRIILFAALNRGYDPARVIAPFRYFVKLALLVPFFHLIRDYTTGSDFLTDLRIAWIRHFRTLPADQQPVVIQLRGAKDGLLRERDSADVEQFPRAREEAIANASHRSIYALPKGRDGDVRYRFLKRMIVSAEGREGAVHTKTDKIDIVFIVHGIRAGKQGWHMCVMKKIQSKYPDALPLPAEYGYFSALNFAIPFLRRRQIRWLQDNYSLYFSLYPEAKFHFIGHSNGTYLLGQSLRKIPSMRFERVTLAGSVLAEDYEWNNFIIPHEGQPTQVAQFRNHIANRDVTVGLLCNMLRGLRMKDVGTAGFDGFTFKDPNYTREIAYYKGGHGQALSDKNLDRIVDYTLTGKDPDDGYSGVQDDGPGYMGNLARLSRYLGVPILLLILALVFTGSFALGPPVLAAVERSASAYSPELAKHGFLSLQSVRLLLGMCFLSLLMLVAKIY